MKPRTFAWALAFLAVGRSAQADPKVVIERATVPWSELERLLRSEAVARPEPQAPLPYALGHLELSGQVSLSRAQLGLSVEVQLLHEGWVEVPLLPEEVALSRIESSGLPPERMVWSRRSGQVVLVARGPGKVQVDLQFEMPLRPGRGGSQLHLSPLGLTTGRARLEVGDRASSIGGATRWRRIGGGRVEATLGADGIDLTFGDPEGPAPLANSLESLEAVTHLTLAGSGATRVRLRATPDERGVLSLRLPVGASAWRLWVGSKPVPVATVSDGPELLIPLPAERTVELVYTFVGDGLGIRGQLRLELPEFRAPIRGAGWDLWLPDGLRYSGVQAALGPADECHGFRGKVPIEAQGSCRAFARPVLGLGVAYVELSYDQLR
ncbi:MAG: hypothetical protein IPG45_38655 [Deltaproteobacteria bacterium]|nr:hypothetical protein [Deltaproteobacteria bacterium]